jgi:hypothetical protein
MLLRVGVGEVVDHDHLKLTSFLAATFMIVIADQHSSTVAVPP